MLKNLMKGQWAFVNYMVGTILLMAGIIFVFLSFTPFDKAMISGILFFIFGIILIILTKKD